MPPRLTPEIIKAAIAGFEAQKNQLDAQIAELRAILPAGSSHNGTALEAGPPKRKRFSAAARRKMAAAQKARWAKVRGQSEPAAAPANAPVKNKRQISPEGMARIIAATKARWARVKAAKRGASESVHRKKSGRKKAA
jgi:hypothetical protein